MTVHAPDSCCSDFVLDRFRHGEMDAEEAAAQREHLATSALCAARLAELTSIRAAFLAEMPAFIVDQPTAAADAAVATAVGVDRVSPASTPKRRRNFAWPAGGVAALAAAAVVLLVVRSPETRTKGDGPAASLTLFVLRDGRVTAAAPAVPLQTGDTLRARVSAQHPAWVVVFEVEQDGDVSRLLPTTPRLQSVAAGDTELDGAALLDEQVGNVDLVALFCRNEVSVDEALLTVRRGELPAGCSSEHHRFQKLLHGGP